jgi:hypothetical protein
VIERTRLNYSYLMPSRSIPVNSDCEEQWAERVVGCALTSYDGTKLSRIKAPAPFGGRFPLFVSPAGEYVFFEKYNALHLANARLVELVTRPMELLRASDLDTPALNADRLDENARSAVKLLRARLEHES